MSTGRRLSRTFPARLVAMSFIVLILLGNCWFALMLVGHDIPAWLRKANKLAMCGAIGGGLWLATLAVREWWHRGES